MIRLYADENVEAQITSGLRKRGVDILTAEEDGYRHTDDNLILDRAGELGRVPFSRDQDFLREQHRGKHRAGHTPASSTPTSHSLASALASALWSC